MSQSVPASVITTINGYTKLFIGTLIDRARTVQAERSYDRICLPPALSISPENAPPQLVRSLIPLLSPPQPSPTGTSGAHPESPVTLPAQNGTLGALNSPSLPYQHQAGQHNSPYPPTSPYGSAPSPISADAPAPPTPTHQNANPQQPPTPTSTTTATGGVIVGYTSNNIPRLASGAIARVESMSRCELLGSELGPLEPDHLREALRRYKKGRLGGGAGFVGLSLEGKENVAVRAGGKRLFK